MPTVLNPPAEPQLLPEVMVNGPESRPGHTDHYHPKGSEQSGPIGARQLAGNLKTVADHIDNDRKEMERQRPKEVHTRFKISRFLVFILKLKRY
jgi:hypothetical protein